MDLPSPKPLALASAENPATRTQYRLFRFIKHLVPNLCGLCGGHSNETLCSECQHTLPLLEECCARCCIPLLGASTCGSCIYQPPSFESAICLVLYQGPIPYLINQFKHHDQRQYGSYLADKLCEKIHREVPQNALPDLLTYVPLHWMSRMTRGFNQAQLIAERISLHTGIQVQATISKTKITKKQQNMNRQQRLKNLKGCYAIKPEIVKGKRVTLIDDVVTTGATMETISCLLMQAGAESVSFWAIARTPSPSY